jgi:quercetin dioxygenase-like cupin family protein
MSNAHPDQAQVAATLEVMHETRAVIIDELASLPLDDPQAVTGRDPSTGYDRPFGLKLLNRDPDSGADHYLVRYPAGLRGRRHRHSAAHTIVVLEGRLEANGQFIGPHAYAHFPAGEVMRHQAADEGPCLFALLFNGRFDVQEFDD